LTANADDSSPLSHKDECAGHKQHQKKKPDNMRASFTVSLRQATRLANDPADGAKNVPQASKRSGAQLQLRNCAQEVITLIREVFKKKEAIPWIPEQEKESVFASLKQVLAVVQGIKCKLGMSTEQKRTNTYRSDQSAIMIKLVIMTLSREVTSLIEHLNDGESGDQVVFDDFMMLEEAANLVKRLTSTLAEACRLIPCDALHTLGELKRKFGLAIIKKMGMQGNIIPEKEAVDRLKRVFEEFDTDRSKEISIDELRAALDAMNIVCTDAVLEKLLASADDDGNGSICFEEFRNLCCSVLRANGICIVPSKVLNPFSEHRQETAASSPLRASRSDSSWQNNQEPPTASPNGRSQCRGKLRWGDGPSSPTRPAAGQLRWGGGSGRNLTATSPGGRPLAALPLVFRVSRRALQSPLRAIVSGPSSPGRSPPQSPMSPLRRMGAAGAQSPIRRTASCYSHLQTGARALRPWWLQSQTSQTT
jgi:hypothetical protein